MTDGSDIDAATRERITAEAIRRGRRRKQRRRAAAAALACVAVVGVASVAVARSDHRNVRVALVTPTTAAPDVTGVTTTTSAPFTSSPARTTTVLPPPPVTTTTPGIRATTTTAAPPPECTASQFVTTLTTDKATYALGEAISITLSVRDTSARACGNVRTAFTPNCNSVRATDGSGTVAWVWGAAPNVAGPACVADLIPVIEGGWHDTSTITWNQDRCKPLLGDPSTSHSCPETQVPAGSYTITGSWGPVPPAPVTVEIRPA